MVSKEGGLSGEAARGDNGGASVSFESESGVLGDTEEDVTLLAAATDDLLGDEDKPSPQPPPRQDEPTTEDEGAEVQVVEELSDAPARRSGRERRPPPRNVVNWDYKAQLTNANAGLESSFSSLESPPPSAGEGADDSVVELGLPVRAVINHLTAEGLPDIVANC